jgi:hypothetical protein
MTHPASFRAAVRPLADIGCHPRAGMSLLEVLVACGILVIGLSSIAAMLPAAGSRLAQATQADRAGVMTANAYAEVVNRGLLAADVFSVPNKACVFGKELGELPTAPTCATAAAPFTAVASGSLAQRIDVVTGFLLQDDLVYRPPTSADTPINDFGSATSSVRRFNEGVCWGAMISSTTTAVMGTPATLSIAVFKKEGASPKAISLTAASGMYRMATSDESDLKRYLPGCSYVLALPSGGNQQPRWFRIASSWKQPNGADCWVTFEDHGGFTSVAGSNATVVGFEHLMRVDQYPVTLE